MLCFALNNKHIGYLLINYQGISRSFQKSKMKSKQGDLTHCL